MGIITIGIELAKKVFAVTGLMITANPCCSGRRSRVQNYCLLIAQIAPCLIGIEACSDAHRWARLFRQHGHTVKLIAPKFVTQ